jgi:hypothetical protein
MRKFLTGLGTVIASLFVFAVPALASGYYDSTYYSASDAAAASVFGLGGLGIWLVCVCCVPLVLGGILAYVVYTDAKKNNVDNPALWAVLTFFFNLLGILIYFLAIRPDAIRKMEGGAASKPADTEKSE